MCALERGAVEISFNQPGLIENGAIEFRALKFDAIEPRSAKIGAGEIGAATAFALARRARVTDVRLIDGAGSIAAGKANNLTTVILNLGAYAKINTSSQTSIDAHAAATQACGVKI